MKKFICLFIFALVFASNLKASEPQIWSIGTRTEVLKGDARGVSISDTGTITLAPKLSETFRTEQPYVWSSAVDASGNVFLGTGSDGRIYRVDTSGAGKLFSDLNEINVSALTFGKDNFLYAGTSPDGKVYRIDASGNATVFFDPKEKYIWSLAILSDGSLAVGTGESGKIYRVKSAGADAGASLLFDTSETHIISLATDTKGNLYAGTDAGGMVLRFTPDGKPFAMLDSPLREIHDLAIGDDGSVYALALSESVAASKSAARTTTSETTAAANDALTTAPTPEPAPKSRYDLTGAKSAVYRITPDGGTEVVWNSATVAAFSIAANPNGGVLIGTSDKGRIYSISNDGRETLLLQSNEGQISKLTTRGRQVFAASSNQGKLYRFGAETVSEGIYESTVLNAKTTADWGKIWETAKGDVVIETRSGNTEKPNETWSAWSATRSEASGAQVQSPRAKFLQWRATLKGAATLSEVNVAYLPQNIAPEILSIQILPAGVGLVAAPPIPVDPNIESSGIDPTVFGLPPIVNIPPRKVYQRGAQSLQWTAEDRNGDRLEYAVYYREANEETFKLLKDNLRDNFFTLDGLALTDGRYIFKITATDSPSNPTARALSGGRISEPFDIDNTAPTVTPTGAARIVGDHVNVSFDASDSSSRLQNAEYSVNGGEWQTVYASDGISDSPRERYTFEVPLKNAGEYTITLRVFDASGNVGNSRVIVKK